MSLVYWLPMVSDELKNQGLSNATPVNNGTTVGTAGKLGKCRDFSGNAQYIDTGYKESFGTGDFTISLWAKLNVTSGKSYQPIISNKTTAAVSVGVAIYYNQSQNKFLWSTADGSGSTEIWTANTFSASTINGKWMHIVMVRNSSDPKKGYFYIDGVRQELASVPVIRNVTNTTYNLMIGDIANHGHTGYIWTGSISDVRIYDEALSPKQIKLLSQGLVLHYTLAAPGGENLLRNTNVSSTEAGKTGFILGSTISSGTTVTLSVQIDAVDLVLSGNKRIGFEGHETNGTDRQYIGAWTSKQGTFSERIYKTVTVTRDFPVGNKSFGIYIQTVSSGSCTISNPKIEIGSTATPWTPNSADPEYAEMGFNNGIEYDVSGYGNNGIKVGTITYSSDTPKYNTSSYFSGSGCYIHTNAGTWNWFDFSQCTISAWLKPTTTPSGYSGAIGIAHDQANGHKTFAITNHAGKFMVYYNNGSYSSVDSGYTLPLNEWHFCVATLNGTTVNLYVDGILKKTQTINWGSASLSNVMRIQVAVDFPGTDEKYTGYCSDVRIYTTVLSAEDILELYNTPVHLTSNGALLTSGELTEV